MIATRISVRTVTLAGGVVFLFFALTAFFMDPDDLWMNNQVRGETSLEKNLGNWNSMNGEFLQGEGVGVVNGAEQIHVEISQNTKTNTR